MSVESSVQQPIAMWNNARGVWETPQVSLLCEHLGLFSETWPQSGMMLDGQVFELPMQEHLTVGSEFSSLPIQDEAMLRTPSAIEGQGGAISEKQSRERGRMLQVRDQIAQLAAENGLKVSDAIASQLLPTPRASEPGSTSPGYGDSLNDFASRVSKGYAPKDLIENLLPTPNTMEHREIKTPEQIAELKAKSPGGYRNLRESVVNELLPTPITRDYKDGSAAQERDGKVSTDTVARAVFNSGEVTDISWGKFEPAIRRWEKVTGRPAPMPTKPDGKDGAHRLSSKLTEWMMGLPDGWVTDVGLSRVEELKACGNGVVPQQAELALNLLLDGISID